MYLKLGKSTHISMISNSVTHLQSYNNSAIEDIARVSAPSSDVSTPSADLSASSADIVASNGECSSVLWCFTMF